MSPEQTITASLGCLGFIPMLNSGFLIAISLTKSPVMTVRSTTEMAISEGIHSLHESRISALTPVTLRAQQRQHHSTSKHNSRPASVVVVCWRLLMYKIEKLGTGFVIYHYASGDPNPTPTEQIIETAPKAWEVAFGRAAKMALMLGRPEIVEAHDGRVYRITVEKL